ncbi:hypothetical protein [Halocatena marina]|uniref:hypothetical protein n=1 Tax=Halocatena marina TaxID=2934937 RepID=UPI00200CA9F4|nr:hypothetical protein [Halocatena marina]
MTSCPFEIGDTVIDRDDSLAPRSVVVSLPSKAAADWLMYGGVTVAQANPQYPADASIVVVVAVNDVDRYLPEWDAETPLARSTLNEAGIYYRASPACCLTTAEPDENSPTDLDDINAAEIEDCNRS